MKILFCIIAILLFKSHVEGQDIIRIAGNVISSTDRLPLERVSIKLKNSGVTTLSDSAGSFSIEVDRKDYLIVTHIGFQAQTIRVGSLPGNSVTITLVAEVLSMNEVVISNGYEEMKKRHTTGSFEKIDNELLNRSTGTSILSRLDGVAGSLIFDKRPGADAPLRIRGISTLGNASTKPLIIVDNFPYDGNIENINPTDVESITILKDAAAAAIWGTRAGNGVIIITTKKSRYNQPLSVSLHSGIIISPKPNLLSINTISTSDYIDVEKYLFSNGFYDFEIGNPYYFPPLSPVVEILADQRNGVITEAETSTKINSLKGLDIRNEFEKYLYRNEITWQYGVNIHGGGNGYKYYLSAGYDKNMENLVGNQSERITIRSNNTFQPVKNLEIGFSMSYSKIQSKDNSPGGYNDLSIGGTEALYPYLKFTDDADNPIPYDYIYSHSFTDTAGRGKLLNWKYNPIDELGNVNRTSETDALVIDLGIKYSFSKAFNAEMKYQFQNSPGNSDYLYKVNSFYARNTINQFTQINGTEVNYIVPYGGILDKQQSKFYGNAIRGQLNFNKLYSSKHLINVIAGGEVRETGSQFYSSRVYGFDADRLGYTLVDYINYYPTFANVQGDALIPSNDGIASLLNRYVSVFSNASYIYNNRYVISGSFRKDASNLFGVKANQKGTPLWSAGASWNLSQESFYHSALVPFLKVRATYGYSGNVSYTVSALPVLRYFPATSQRITGLSYNVITNYPNPALQWEKVAMLNLGVDFSTIGNRISASVEFYIKDSKNLFGREPLDPTTGAISITSNSAAMKGKGFDLTLHSNNIVSKNFNWQTDFLFSSVRNKVTKYLYDLHTDGFTSNGDMIYPIPGYEPYQIVANKYKGLNEEGMPVGYINGKESVNYDSILYKTPLKDQAIIGSAIPHLFGSLRNMFSWKQISLSFNILFKAGYYFRKPSIDYYSLYYYGKGTADISDRWQKPGDENMTNVPALNYPLNFQANSFYQNADINVLKGDHIRLDDVRIDFEMPKFIRAKLKMKDFNFFIYMKDLNILIWKSNNENLDPEFPDGLKTPLHTSFGVNIIF